MPEPHPMGGRLKALRGRAGLTQLTLAQALGLTRERIAQVETGGGRLGFDSTLRLWSLYRADFEALGVETLEDLIGETEPRGDSAA